MRNGVTHEALHRRWVSAKLAPSHNGRPARKNASHKLQRVTDEAPTFLLFAWDRGHPARSCCSSCPRTTHVIGHSRQQEQKPKRVTNAYSHVNERSLARATRARSERSILRFFLRFCQCDRS